MLRRARLRIVTAWTHVGVDRAAGAWVAVGYATDTPAVSVHDCIADLWAAHGSTAERVVVDVPIGLCESLDAKLGTDSDAADCGCVATDGELSRRCDDLARQVLGPRSSSVFTPPCREAARLAADGAPYAEVNATNRRHTGKGLMRQAANISGGIVEVDRLLRAGDGDPAVLVEGHPEVCFRSLAGRPLQHPKRDAAGVDERLSALERVDGYAPGDWRALARALRGTDRRVGLDDLLDAAVLALTARAPVDKLWTLPADPGEDCAGLPMQMVYRAAAPLEPEQ
jgi:predicted RNase H-like nuclease